MLHLMRLELRKHKLPLISRGVWIVWIVLIGLFSLFYFDRQLFGDNPGEPLPEFDGYSTAFSIILTFANITFTIYGATLLSRIVIAEFRNKSMTLMFTYPVSRYRMMTAKLLLVFLWTFNMILLSGLIMGTLLVIAEQYFHFIPEQLTMDIVWTLLAKMAWNALCAACIVMIPLYFGMRKYSTVETIVAAIIIGGLMNGNTNGFSLNQIFLFPLGLAIVGILAAVFTLRNIQEADMS